MPETRTGKGSVEWPLRVFDFGDSPPKPETVPFDVYELEPGSLCLRATLCPKRRVYSLPYSCREDPSRTGTIFSGPNAGHVRDLPEDSFYGVAAVDGFAVFKRLIEYTGATPTKAKPLQASVLTLAAIIEQEAAALVKRHRKYYRKGVAFRPRHGIG